MKAKIFTTTNTPNVFMVYKTNKETEIVIFCLGNHLDFKFFILSDEETKALTKQLVSSDPIEYSDAKVSRLIIYQDNHRRNFKIREEFKGSIEIALSLIEIEKLIKFLEEGGSQNIVIIKPLGIPGGLVFFLFAIAGKSFLAGLF